VNTKFLCSLAVAGAFAFGGTGSAIAAPAGPEGPANCSFSGGTTTCAQVGAPVVTTSTSTDDAGCTLTYDTTTITTTYSAHHGTYNSNGAAVAAPASTSSQSTVLASTVCPPPAGNSAREACEAYGYHYNEPGGDYYGNGTDLGPIHFTCGQGDNLTLAQAQQITFYDQSLAHECQAIYNAWSTVDNANQTDFTGPGWYFVCEGTLPS